MQPQVNQSVKLINKQVIGKIVEVDTDYQLLVVRVGTELLHGDWPTVNQGMLETYGFTDKDLRMA